ncbi:MAG: sugar phosphate isomerase/epimerase family protein [Verrucomicrobiota bacterium]|nr:sugar phosphate isomerase/epimerase family protein [Verrucomicrobiota bacterium]
MNEINLNRRDFGKASSLALVATALPALGQAVDEQSRPKPRILKSIKFGMFGGNLPIADKFRALKEIGYDGVELNSPGGVDKKQASAASRETGLPIHGVVDSIHWGTRLSSPDAATRRKGLEGLKTAIRDTRLVGGSAVLLVPGAVRDAKNENHQQVWDRSIEQINLAIPLAAKFGIHILIENVWNNFLYDPKGDNNQPADLLAKYLDEINSPWVGSYFDIGNHQRFGKPAEWIRTLGKRIVKLDVKDWGKSNGFCKIGDGDVDWPDVREALGEIGFTGWSTAEVGGGNRDRIKEIHDRMDKHLLGKG